jgi:hypothetical protein
MFWAARGEVGRRADPRAGAFRWGGTHFGLGSESERAAGLRARIGSSGTRHEVSAENANLSRSRDPAEIQPIRRSVPI